MILLQKVLHIDINGSIGILFEQAVQRSCPESANGSLLFHLQSETNSLLVSTLQATSEMNRAS
jgi:hypothetical protein